MAECKICGYTFGQVSMKFSDEVREHSLNDHDGKPFDVREWGSNING